MKFLDKLDINTESKICASGIIFAIVGMLIIMAVAFLWIVANNLNILMSQPADETYTYLISIMYRIMIFVLVGIIIPLTIYQITQKSKSKIDITISSISIIIVIIMFITFFGGEIYYFNKYSNGELSYSKLFCHTTIETKIFDYILKNNAQDLPQKCLPTSRPTQNK